MVGEGGRVVGGGRVGEGRSVGEVDGVGFLLVEEKDVKDGLLPSVAGEGLGGDDGAATEFWLASLLTAFGCLG